MQRMRVEEIAPSDNMVELSQMQFVMGLRRHSKDEVLLGGTITMGQSMQKPTARTLKLAFT